MFITLLFVLILNFINLIFCACPNTYLIDPCICLSDWIVCGGNSTYDLVKIFNNLSKNLPNQRKHFKRLTVESRGLSQLTDNTFKDITFDEMSIYYCESLTHIHRNAFNGTNSILKRIFINSNENLNNSSVFEALNTLTNIELIYIRDNNIEEIPSKAFNSLKHLNELYFGGKAIEKIGSNAFKPLSSLTRITFYDTSIAYLPEDVFAFDTTSDNELIIDFQFNRLINSSSFDTKSLMNIKRPTYLKFYNRVEEKMFKYVDEKVFLLFLMTNELNTIELLGEPFDCNDCRNYWLKKQNLLNRMRNTKCSNGYQLTDSRNFVTCKS